MNNPITTNNDSKGWTHIRALVIVNSVTVATSDEVAITVTDPIVENWDITAFSYSPASPKVGDALNFTVTVSTNSSKVQTLQYGAYSAGAWIDNVPNGHILTAFNSSSWTKVRVRLLVDGVVKDSEELAISIDHPLSVTYDLKYAQTPNGFEDAASSYTVEAGSGQITIGTGYVDIAGGSGDYDVQWYLKKTNAADPSWKTHGNKVTISDGGFST